LLIETPQYIIFAIFNFCFCPIIYFFLVETKKRSLEEVLGLDVDPTHISSKGMETLEIGETKV
jgi:hypothetical protein